ncbi:unnamed protein product [Wickerhamomyces anomalus]
MPEQQQNNIQKLDKDVAVVLRSHVVISSLTDALREVIQNMVIDIQALSFTVKDDGVGMSPDDLSEVGSLNYTSKLKTLDELRKNYHVWV